MSEELKQELELKQISNVRHFNSVVAMSLGYSNEPNLALATEDVTIEFSCFEDKPWTLKKLLLIHGELTEVAESFFSLEECLDLLTDDEFVEEDFGLGPFLILVLGVDDGERRAELFIRTLDFGSAQLRTTPVGLPLKINKTYE